MKRDTSIKFLQSQKDFPCPVTLGRVAPSFGLHRFKQGLRFVPPDDEGFILRGDKRRLLYKGRRKSHRFTILGDTSFEYDCILLKEPESNIITLRMEGAENFDFFRQPDFVKVPFLKGSYAVYKKETLVGEGTGKLCHIHRPEIIDAMGRRCWGELAVIGNELHIIIPEDWLSNAKYPVVVDPTVGTTTVGSQNIYYDEDNEDYYELYLEFSLGVNRFLVSDLFNGNATAYVYAYNDDYWGRCMPVLYSDNGNTPLYKRSANENLFDIEVRNGKPAGWRSTAFQSNTSISSGSYLWFGLFCEWFAPKFDYGAKLYKDWWDHLGNDIPNTYPLYDANYYYDFKLSMYFTYTSAQNHVRTITQGVKLTDTRRLTGNYIRIMTQNAGVNSLIKRFENVYRKCVMTVGNSMSISRFPFLFRSITEQIKVLFDFDYLRLINRKCTENVNISSQESRKFNAIRKVHDDLNFMDNQLLVILFLRRLPDTLQVNHTFLHWGAFIRGLKFNSENIADTTRIASYKRFTADSVNAVGTVFRGLLLYVRIVSKIFIRDYILGRFLKAKEDFILKSTVCREIILESKID